MKLKILQDGRGKLSNSHKGVSLFFVFHRHNNYVFENLEPIPEDENFWMVLAAQVTVTFKNQRFS